MLERGDRVRCGEGLSCRREDGAGPDSGLACCDTRYVAQPTARSPLQQKGRSRGQGPHLVRQGSRGPRQMEMRGRTSREASSAWDGGVQWQGLSRER